MDVLLVVDYHHQHIDNHQDPVDGKVVAQEDVGEEELAQGAPRTVAADEVVNKPSHSFQICFSSLSFQF